MQIQVLGWTFCGLKTILFNFWLDQLFVIVNNEVNMTEEKGATPDVKKRTFQFFLSRLFHLPGSTPFHFSEQSKENDKDGKTWIGFTFHFHPKSSFPLQRHAWRMRIRSRISMKLWAYIWPISIFQCRRVEQFRYSIGKYFTHRCVVDPFEISDR